MITDDGFFLHSGNGAGGRLYYHKGWEGFRFQGIDALPHGALVTLTEDVSDKGETYKKGEQFRIFWVGVDKYNPKTVRLGLKGKVGKTFYVHESKVERYIKYPNAPLAKGDRVRSGKHSGVVFYVKRQEKHNLRLRGGKVGRRYGTPHIEGAQGDWLIGITWDDESLNKTRKFLYADFDGVADWKVKDEAVA